MIQLAAGRDHTCALHGDGAVSCWGSNDTGEIGDGTKVTRMTPVRVLGLSQITAIAAREQHTCALDKTGDVWCWGEGEPVRRIGVTGAKQLSDGCALVGDGGVECWRPTDPPITIAIDDATYVAGEFANGCAVRKSGKVVCWADGVEPNAVGNVSAAVAVAVGSDFACARRRDGTVMCWGDNIAGQLGRGRSSNIVREEPAHLRAARVPLVTNAVEIAAGHMHACVRTKTDDVLCWGQRADDTVSERLTARAQKRFSGASTIATGFLHDCVIAKAGVQCWGNNMQGQLGTGWSAVRYTPAQVPGVSNVARVHSSYRKTYALLNDGTLMSWGAGDPKPKVVKGATNVEQISGALDVIARTKDGKLFHVEGHAAIKAPGVVRDMSAGMNFGCGIVSGGAVCWGDRSYGQFGNVEADYNWAPNALAVAPGLADATQIACGSYHTCAVHGHGAVTCWGDDTYDDTLSKSIPPTAVAITDATQVAAGTLFTCALRSSGHVACWGQGPRGELGTGEIVLVLAPADVVDIDDGVQLVAQNETACVRRKSGTIACWGRGAEGQLGPDWNDPSDPADGAAGRSHPVAIAGITDAIDLSTSGDHTCAVTKDGNVWCWGAASDGQVGTQTAITNTPVAVAWPR